MRYYPLVLSILAAIIITSGCEDNTGPDQVSVRYVYYAIGDTASNASAGLYRYSMDGGVETIDTKSVAYLTQVASNGIVLFEAPGLAHRLYGICEDGAVIPVPFPVSPDPHFEYVYAMPPHITLAANGHHTVYAVDMVPMGQPNSPQRTSKLVLFNCAIWQMTLIDADSLLATALAGEQATGGFVTGDYTAVSAAGSTIWFTADIVGGEFKQDTLGTVLAEWNEGNIRILRQALPGEIALVGYSGQTGTLVFEEDGALQCMHLPSDAALPYDTAGTSGVQQWHFGYNTANAVRWTDNGLELQLATDGSYVKHIAALEDFESAGGRKYLYNESNHISLSPDGTWAVITCTVEENPQTCDLFVVSTTDGEIALLGQDLSHGFARISSLINQ